MLLRWIGGADDAIYFMGDYVDKGPDGKQVLEFIKELTTAFPDRIVALIGNHDLYLLSDTMLAEGSAMFMGASVRIFSYAFSHPEDYLNWLEPADRRDVDDHLALNALYQALQVIYKKGKESYVVLRPLTEEEEGKWPGRKALHKLAPPLKGNETLSRLVLNRLETWQKQQSLGMMQSGLAKWLSTLKLIAVAGDALLVHGGVPSKSIRRIARDKGERFGLTDLLESVNGRFSDLFNSQDDGDGIPPRGRAVDDMGKELIHDAVTYRGYFHPKEGCGEVERALAMLRPHGIKRIIVGHTAEDDVRFLCGGQLIAADSALSRAFRAYGNLYCPLRHSEAPGPPPLADSGCDEVYDESCQGQIVEMQLVGGTWQHRALDNRGRTVHVSSRRVSIENGGGTRAYSWRVFGTGVAVAVTFVFTLSYRFGDRLGGNDVPARSMTDQGHIQ